MNFFLKHTKLYKSSLTDLPQKKIQINTINAHCYNIAQKDKIYARILEKSDVLLPDGISIVIAARFLMGSRLVKIAGADLFYYEMQRLNRQNGTCFFLGSSTITLKSIYDRAKMDFPNVDVYYYAPPFKSEFSTNENSEIIASINKVKPDVLFIGMTAPKQEKWAYCNYNALKTKHICCIGAVFDFYSAKVLNRAPNWVINLGFEWFYRLINEPRRLWRRYLIGNLKFIWYILKEKLSA